MNKYIRKMRTKKFRQLHIQPTTRVWNEVTKKITLGPSSDLASLRWRMRFKVAAFIEYNLKASEYPPIPFDVLFPGIN